MTVGAPLERWRLKEVSIYIYIYGCGGALSVWMCVDVVECVDVCVLLFCEEFAAYVCVCVYIPRARVCVCVFERVLR